MGNRFSFSEDSLKEITEFYNGFLQGVNEQIINLIEKFNESKEATHYQVIAKEGNAIIQFYNETIVKNILNSCQEWGESENSIKNMAKKLNVGEEAEETADKLTKALIDSIEVELKGQNEIDLTGTHDVDIKTEDFEELKTGILNCAQQLEEIIIGHKRACEDLIEENIAACGLNAAIATVEGSVVLPFKSVGEKTIDSLRESFEGKIDLVNKVAQEGAEQAKASAEKSMSESETQLMEDMLKFLEE